MVETVSSSQSREAEVKDRAASVVMVWREVDWDAVERGDGDAVSKLLAACEAHETTRRFLEEEGGDLGVRLNEGLERFYADSVGPRLRRPEVLALLQMRPAATPDGARASAPDGAEATGEDGLMPRARPTVTVGHTVRMNTGCGHLYVTINESADGRPFELFNHMGKAGGCAASQNEAIGRLISYALRCGAKLDPLIKQLKGISCHRPAWGEDGKISSCSDAIGKALEHYSIAAEARQAAAATAAGPSDGSDLVAERAALDDSAERWAAPAAPPVRAPKSNGSPGRSVEASRVQGACVDCGSQLSYEEGCVKCHSCGFTECG